MTGQAKVQLILELKNKMKTGITKAKQSVNSNVRDIKNKITDWKSHHINAFKAMRAEVPLLDRALTMLKNPYVLLAGGLIGLGVLFTNLTKKAAEFEHAFLPIKQLNLDKSSQQLNNYQKQIKNAAFEVGTNLIDSTKAFYDLQSGTGLFGKEAVDVFKRVGTYSIITGANINDATNSVVKAMKAFGLGVQDIDMLLASNAKTVQQGIVTFDELAKVQTEYAGAAAMAGQSVDTANKLFSAFTSIAKNANTGATMVKTAFEGLTQKSTIDGLKDMLNVDMYNKTTGKMRDMGSILKDVSAKFKTMSSQDIDAVINKIGGPEGLRNMFGKLKTGADEFFTAMDNFDKTEFNFAKALENAKNDATTIARMAQARKDIIAVEIGQRFLPIWVTVLEKINNLLKFVWDNFDTIRVVIRNVAIGLGTLKLAMMAFNLVTWSNPIGAIAGIVAGLIIYMTQLVKKTEGWGKSWAAIKDIISITWKQAKSDFEFMTDAIKTGIQIIILRFKGMGQYLKQLWNNIGEAMQLALDRDFSGAKAALSRPIVTQASQEIDQLKREFDAKKTAYITQTQQNADAVKAALGNISIKWKKKAEEADEDTASNPFASDGDTPANSSGVPSAAALGVKDITGSAKQIRNLTINIDALNKGNINTENTTLQHMDAQELEEWFTKMMMRVVRNTELSY